MEAGTGGGPKVCRDSIAVEESARLWRNPADLTRTINHPAQRSKEIGGAHIAATTDSTRMSWRSIYWSRGHKKDAGVVGKVVPLETYAY